MEPWCQKEWWSIVSSYYQESTWKPLEPVGVITIFLLIFKIEWYPWTYICIYEVNILNFNAEAAFELSFLFAPSEEVHSRINLNWSGRQGSVDSNAGERQEN